MQYYDLRDNDFKCNLFAYPAFTSAIIKMGGRQHKVCSIFKKNTSYRAVLIMAVHCLFDSDVKQFTIDLCK